MIEVIKKKIKDFFIKILKDNETLLSFYNFCYVSLNKRRFLKEITYRKKLSIFDYKNLSKGLPFCPFERIKDSNFYGQAFSLQNYAGVSSVNYSIEHGLYFDDYIPKASFLQTTHRILTMSDIRKNVLSRTLKKEILSIGPYIHYAQSILSEREIVALKKDLGKVLLFFPTHTCKDGGQTYDIAHTISKIKRIAEQKKCDTILVCMYYRDILNSQYADRYEEAGIKVVTAGHQLDLYFLSRLKSIICLSDFTISNNVGTHTGYCVFLGKPHYIFESDLVLSDSSLQFQQIGRAFFDDHETITVQQRNLTSLYWGFDCIKSNEELKELFSGYGKN